MLYFFSFLHCNSKPFPARGFAQVLNPAQAEERLVQYRTSLLQSNYAGDFHSGYCFKIRFRHMPRRGEEKQFYGSISGPSLKSGSFRIEIYKKEGGQATEVFLLQNPRVPKLWKFSKEDNQTLLESEEVILQPIISGINQTFFDLLMPFVFWDGEYLHSGKVAGRPSHLFNFRSPEWIRKSKPDWDKVVLAIDDAYYAPLRAEIFTKSSRLLRSNTLRSYKKVGEQWIVKSLDCTNQTDRSNTRLEIIGAATQLDLSPRFFGENSFQHPLPISDSAFTIF